MLIQKISPHLKKLAKNSPEIKKEFYRSKEEELFKEKDFLDPLLEEKFTPVKGLIHKYLNRVLILLTTECASYCRFCTRRRIVSEIKKGKIFPKDLEKMVDYLKNHPEVKEIILSGGDPFMVPKTLKLALKKFSALPQIKIIRIGTRVPVSNPRLVTDEVLRTFSKIKQPVYVLIHFEHPKEITPQTIEAVEKLRKFGAILFSQTVFLKGVNDKVEILEELFDRLIEIGVKPYYIFHCDSVAGTKHFWVKIEKEIEIMTELRKRLSGLAYPLYVIDVPHGFGKIPVPLNFWKFSLNYYKDFKGKKNIINIK